MKLLVDFLSLALADPFDLCQPFRLLLDDAKGILFEFSDDLMSIFGPIPLIAPEARYRSREYTSSGTSTLKDATLNCCP